MEVVKPNPGDASTVILGDEQFESFLNLIKDDDSDDEDMMHTSDEESDDEMFNGNNDDVAVKVEIGHDDDNGFFNNDADNELVGENHDTDLYKTSNSFNGEIANNIPVIVKQETLGESCDESDDNHVMGLDKTSNCFSRKVNDNYKVKLEVLIDLNSMDEDISDISNDTDNSDSDGYCSTSVDDENNSDNTDNDSALLDFDHDVDRKKVFGPEMEDSVVKQGMQKQKVLNTEKEDFDLDLKQDMDTDEDKNDESSEGPVDIKKVFGSEMEDSSVKQDIEKQKVLNSEKEDFDFDLKQDMDTDEDKSNESSEDPVYECGVCGKQCEGANELSDHMGIHIQGAKQYVCPNCDKVFLKQRQLQTHKCCKFECSICKKTFYFTRFQIKHHMNTHTGARFPCKQCNKSFSHPQSLSVHMKLHNNSSDGKLNYFSCEICSKLYTSEENLKLHMEIHKGTQKFECELCYKTFSRISDFKRHAYVHTGEKPYKCDLCPKAYNKPGDLGRHQAWHRGDTACKYCQKKYVRKDELLQHIRKYHEKQTDIQTDNPLQCKKCQKIMSNEKNLKMHLDNHELKEQAPVVKTCKICDKEFSSLPNLYKHVSRVHNMERYDYKENYVFSDSKSAPKVKNKKIEKSKDDSNNSSKLQCDQCFKWLKNKRTLKEHIDYVHLKKFNFACDQCDMKFYKSKPLRKHIQKEHSG